MGKIHEAIKSVQAQITALEMTTATIPHKGGGSHSYTYLSEPTLMDALRPLLSGAGVATYISTEDRGKDGNMSRSRATLRFVHSEDDSEVVVTSDGQATASDDKGLAMAHTSAVRQALHKTFMVPNYRSGDDPEQRQPTEYQRGPTKDEERDAKRLENLKATAADKGYAGWLSAELTNHLGATGLMVPDAAWLQGAETTLAANQPAEGSPAAARNGQAPTPAPTPAAPQTAPQTPPSGDPPAHLAPLYEILGKLQTAKPDGGWVERMSAASQSAFSKPLEQLTATEAAKLQEKMEATLIQTQASI